MLSHAPVLRTFALPGMRAQVYRHGRSCAKPARAHRTQACAIMLVQEAAQRAAAELEQQQAAVLAALEAQQAEVQRVADERRAKAEAEEQRLEAERLRMEAVLKEQARVPRRLLGRFSHCVCVCVCVNE